MADICTTERADAVTGAVPLISVVVPVYKAEGCLLELYRRLVSSLETISPAFEIVLVEDCGGDRSWEIIEELSRADRRVRGIQLSRNFGQHYGITAGMDHARGEWAVVMDCDLQDRPEEIPLLYAKACEGYDVVLALRGKRQHSLNKRLISWAFYRIFNFLSGLNYNGEVGNFRIMSRKVIDAFGEVREQLRFFGGIVEWLGFPTAHISVQHDKRFHGETTYTYAKLLRLASQTIIAYSDKPLWLAVWLGLTLAAFAFLFGCYIIFRTVQHGTPVLGWSSLMVSIYFLCGIIIAVLGIIGIYLGKTFDETKKRPLYLVGKSTF